MTPIQTTKMSNFRWVICALLFLATTVNYMDRQVLSLTWKDFIAVDFHWTDADYGLITGAFSLFYAVANLFAGKFIDWMGTKKGYLIAIFVWSLGACLHAGCGWVAMETQGYSSVAELGQLTGDAAVAIATISVWLFLSCRLILAVGEAGNFPAAIKATAEYFPKKDRAFSTSIFNSGASVGALAAPATIPLLARAWGWEMAFIIIGALGFVWMGLWSWLYEKPRQNKRVNQAELNYIEQDNDLAEVQDRETEKEEKTIPFMQCFTFKQTWSFLVGKFMTDGVWWFFLFWAPAYFSDQYGYTSDSGMGIALIFTLYAIVTVLSIGGGYLPKYFVEKRGMNPYLGRMRAMFIFACFPVLGLLAQPLGVYSAWWPAILIGLLGAGHQAWSANLFSTVGDMFPKSTIGTLVGLGTMAGGIGSMSINYGSGYFFKWAAEQGSAFSFFGFDGKPAAYMVVFCICSVAYLIGWFIMKALVPKYKPVVVE
ncbi:MAG: MFS transporter [Prevotella sp.]|nr:MFS transporter [Prevotella sp.]MBR3479447.1 MFS transporter [Prevotella sp.]MBR3479502.1 MFS transporter [Prevotella sp.]